MKLCQFFQLVGCSVLIADAAAQSVAYESFAGLPLGPSLSVGGTDSYGWSSNWTGEGVSDSRFQIISPVPSLSYQVPGGGLIQGGNRALQLSTAPEPVPIPLSITRRFPNQNTTVYLSFLMRFPESGTGSDLIEINVLNTSEIITTIRFTPSNPSPPVGNLSFLRNGNGTGSGISGDASNTHLVVFKITPNNSYTYWLDPLYSNGNKSASSQGSISSVFDGISLSIVSSDSAGPATTVIIDEFRVGYTWDDVVLLPPPLSLVPSVAIEQAVNLRWQSQINKTYQVQYSYNLTTWFNLGSVITGNGQIKDFFDSTNSDAKKFYRIQIQ